LSWFLGDIVFWLFFPQRINATGRAIGATTMTDVIVDGVKPQMKTGIKWIIGVLIITCLAGYVSAQWLAGQKFLRGAFGFDGPASLLSFAVLIVVYTAIGGFRGSVYVDSMQAIIRVIGTAIAMVTVGVVASHNFVAFWRNIHAAGPSFLQILPHDSIAAAVPFIIGFAAAALGFGLGQPQMVTRYLAGANPRETQRGWLPYNLFVQGTWISMTLFGMVLRGVMSSLPDPEMGLSVFFRTNTGAILTGIITADIFATIAATSNSLLVAMAQTASRDLFGRSNKLNAGDLWPITATLGTLTMLLSLRLHSTVVNLALSSVSLLGAGLAPAMLIRLLNWRRTDSSLIATIFIGTGTAILWRFLNLGGLVNEAAPGIAAALIANFVAARFEHTTSPSLEQANASTSDNI
jgi:Na+/pantothenate symporter